MSSRSRRWLWVGVSLLALYTLVGFFVAPAILRSQLAKRLTAELGRDVKIAKLRLNPYVFSLTIEGLAIADRDGAPFLGWQRVYVNFAGTSFFVREWRFQKILAMAPMLRVTMNKDGQLNFADLIAKFAPPPGQATAKSEAKPGWPLRVKQLEVSAARLDFSDHSRSAEFATQTGPVSFVLTDFHTLPGSGAPYEFAATTEIGEKLQWRGTVSAAPLGSQGEFSLTGIKLAKYAPYYRDMVAFDLTSGSLDVSGRYQVDLSGSAPLANLSNAALHLTGFKLAPRGQQMAAIEIEDLAVTGVDAELAKQVVSVAKVGITGGRIAARRGQDAKIDLVDLLSPVTAAKPSPLSPRSVSGASGPASAAVSAVQTPTQPDVKIGEVTVRNFSGSFEDQTTPRVAMHAIENLEFDAKKLTLAAGAELPLRVALALPNQGQIRVDGTVVISPLKADLAIELADVALASVSPYVEPLVNVRIAQGAVSTKGRATLSMPTGAAPEFTFRGDASINRFSTVDGASSQEFASWSSLAMHGIEVSSSPQALAVQEIVWSEPTARLIVNRDGSNNLATILRLPAKSAPNPNETAPISPPASAGTPSPAVVSPGKPSSLNASAASPPPQIAIGKFVIDRGAFTLTDHSVEPGVNVAIDQFGGTIAGLSSTNLAKADVDLHATVDGVGPVVVVGELDPLSAEKFVDLKLDFKNVDLTPFSPYSGKFAGYELARGKLFLDVTAKLVGAKVDVANVVTITQFNFGAATNSPVATKLPVRLGVALLKDLDGKMVIDIPVQGDLGDPSFGIGRVVLRVVVNLLTKAAVSPFSLVGAMFGGGGEELAYQEFAPGSAELTPQGMQKLATLTKALGARPGLNLEIIGSFDSAGDAFTLKQRQLAKDIRAQIWEARRATDPNLPPPDQLQISIEEEAAVAWKLFDAKFPPGTEFGAPLPVAPPPAAPPPPVKRGFLRRVADVVTFKNLRENPPPQENAAPAATSSTTEPSVGPSLEDMKLRLADLIVISDDNLRELATARAQRVREHFLQAQIATERLFLGNATGAGQGARVTLQLQ